MQLPSGPLAGEDVTPERVVAADVKSADANKSAAACQDKDKVNGGCR